MAKKQSAKMAVPSPNANERFSGLTTRAIDASTTPKEQAATPRPINTPPPICSQTGVGASAIMTSPAA